MARASQGAGTVKPEPISIEDALAEPMDVYSHHIFRIEDLHGPGKVSIEEALTIDFAEPEPTWLPVPWSAWICIVVIGLAWWCAERWLG